MPPGTPAHITDVLKKVEAAGFDEVILYFNVGLEAACAGEGRDGALHAAGGAALPMSMQDRLELDSRNRLKLGLFGANCSSVHGR